MAQRVLVIKHGAFGDIILATAALKAIRAHHPEAHITVMTTKLFVSLLSACPWVDEVWLDARSHSLKELFTKIRAFHHHQYDVVYDLQTSQRSSLYWWLMPWPKPKWSGIARFASHRHHTPQRKKLHTLDRLREQLEIAGVFPSSEKGESAGFLPDISWMTADIAPFSLHMPYALLIPGGSAHRPEKRWPAQRYAELAEWLSAQGIQPVLIGGEAEREVLDAIRAHAPTALNLCGLTSFVEIAELARHAKIAVGNDTGPTHLAAAAGCPTIALFATLVSNPKLCAPRGKAAQAIAVPVLAVLKLETVVSKIRLLFAAS